MKGAAARHQGGFKNHPPPQENQILLDGAVELTVKVKKNVLTFLTNVISAAVIKLKGFCVVVLQSSWN